MFKRLAVEYNAGDCFDGFHSCCSMVTTYWWCCLLPKYLNCAVSWPCMIVSLCKQYIFNNNESFSVNKSNSQCLLGMCSQMSLQWVGTHKQVSLQPSCTLFTTDCLISKVWLKFVWDGQSRAAETPRTVAHGIGPVLNQITVICRAKPGTCTNRCHWMANVTDVGRT